MESHLVPDKFEDGSNVLSLEISLSSKSFIDEDSSCVFLIPADKKSCDSITKLTVSPTKSIESISFVSFQGDLDSITQIKASDLGSLFSVITCSGKSKELMFLGIDGIVVGARATKGTDRPTGSILGMHWLLGSSFADFIVVASNGIEYYKVFGAAKDSMKPLKVSKYYTSQYYFNREKNFCLMIDSSNVAQGLWIKETSTLRTVKKDLSYLLSDRKTCSIHLTALYDELYVVVLDSSTARCDILSVNPSGFESETSIDLLVPGELRLQVLDDLLVIQNIKAGIPILIDVASKHNPIISPLPFFLDDQKDNSDSYEMKFLQNGSIIKMYTHQKTVKLWRLELNLKLFIETWERRNKIDLLEFLIRRKNGKEYFGEIFSQIAISDYKTVSDELANVLNQVVQGAQIPKKPASMVSPLARSATGIESRTRLAFSRSEKEIGSKEKHSEAKTALVLKKKVEFTQDEFAPLLDTIRWNMDTKQFYSLVFDYLQSLFLNGDPVSETLALKIVDWCSKSGDLGRIQQGLQYRIFPQTEKIADAVLELSKEKEYFFQAGIEILLKISAKSKICNSLLSRKEWQLCHKVLLNDRPIDLGLLEKTWEGISKTNDRRLIEMELSRLESKVSIFPEINEILKAHEVRAKRELAGALL